MAEVPEVIKAAIEGELVTATGGVHDNYSVGRDGLTRKVIADNNVAPIKPAVYLNWSNGVPFGVVQRKLKAERLFVDVYFYQDDGYDVIRTMRGAVRALLEYARFDVDEGWIADIFWRGDITGMFDDELRCCMERTSYEILLVRR